VGVSIRWIVGQGRYGENHHKDGDDYEGEFQVLRVNNDAHVGPLVGPPPKVSNYKDVERLLSLVGITARVFESHKPDGSIITLKKEISMADEKVYKVELHAIDSKGWTSPVVTFNCKDYAQWVEVQKGLAAGMFAMGAEKAEKAESK